MHRVHCDLSRPRYHSRAPYVLTASAVTTFLHVFDFAIPYRELVKLLVIPDRSVYIGQRAELLRSSRTVTFALTVVAADRLFLRVGNKFEM